MNSEGSSDAQAPPASPSLADLNRQRILELFRQSLEEADPLQANLGAGASEVRLISSRLAEAIQAKLDQGDKSLEELAKLAQQIDTYQKLMRQFDRLVGTKSRLSRET